MSPPLLPILLLLAAAGAEGQSSDSEDGNNVQISFRPSVAVVIGIFSIMFSLTFLLLMYAKFCHSSATSFLSSTGGVFVGIGSGGNRSENGRLSGIDKTVIESLPFFQFSALKGSREGLECAVCLSRFDDSEMLRLLPRCKHAFHMDCIDRWLDSHSSCPLCRARVDVDDIAFFKFSTSSRYLHDPSGRPVPEADEQGGESSLDLYIERERDARDGSTSGRLAARFRCAVSGKPPPLHNYKHRIVVSDVVFRSRWSDFNAADLISLDSEMLREMSSRRFDHASGGDADYAGASGTVSQEGVSRIKEEMERKRRLESKAGQMQILPENPPDDYSNEYLSGDMRALISPGSRCMSDITEVARYRPTRGQRWKDENVRQTWLPIARRTVQLFAGKERRSMLQPQSLRDGAENV